MSDSERSTTRTPWLPVALAAAIAVLSLTPRVQASDALAQSFWAASIVLLGWTGALFLLGRREHVGEVSIVLRSQHYIQAMCQIAVLAYWGWYWRPVYDMALLFAAQLAFAYGFAMLLSWSRGVRHTLGFGPVPIILSINLFLWFRDDWFYLQFLMIGVGFLGKEFIRWQREGRSAHIFNPSAFALGLFSLILIASGTTELTWGQEIASTLTLAPHIYLYLFAVGLVVMYFFSITLIAGTAAAVLFALSAGYSAWAGVPYFIDSEIPAAVFLGLHLLITDPSTSPRTPLGKTLFGALYGIGVFGLYALLGAMGTPTFYDKLLCVPLLNLSVRGIDHFVGGVAARNQVGSRLGASRLGASGLSWSATRLNLASMGAWVLFFAMMTAAGRTDGQHAGDSLPFWEASCRDDLANACERLLQIEASYCGDNAAWACNELGLHYTEGAVVAGDAGLGRSYLARACELRLQAACVNLLNPGAGIRTDPRPLDLRLMLREGGLNLMQLPEADLYRRACRHDWGFACDRGPSTT